MQEVNAQWDFHESSPISTITKLYVGFVVVCCIWAIVVFIKSLWLTKAWPSTRRGNLINLSKALQAADVSQISTLAAGIPEDSPEAGLRRLVALKSSPFHELPTDIINRADLHFTYLLSALRATANNLRHLATLFLIFTFAWTSYGLTNVCRGISASKTPGISTLYGAMTEIFGTLSAALFVFAILYVLRWRIVSLLGRRERLWHLLKSQLEILLTPPH